MTSDAESPLISSSIFRAEGDSFLPTPLAQGPWHPDTLHGSPMIALLARAIERHPSDRPRQVTRLCVDMMKAAPRAPLRTDVEVVRGGKNVEFLDARLSAQGEICARATAMRFRTDALSVPEDVPGFGGEPRHPRSEGDLYRGLSGMKLSPEAFHHALDIRPVPGFETPTVWVRFKVPLVAGEENSPLVRIAVAADFVYSIPVMRRIMEDPSQLDARTFSAINPDTSMNLHRPLVGEWVCLDARVGYDPIGAGTALAGIFDDQGPVGHISQSILLRGSDKTPRVVRDHLKG